MDALLLLLENIWTLKEPTCSEPLLLENYFSPIEYATNIVTDIPSLPFISLSFEKTSSFNSSILSF